MNNRGVTGRMLICEPQVYGDGYKVTILVTEEACAASGGVRSKNTLLKLHVIACVGMGMMTLQSWTLCT